MFNLMYGYIGKFEAKSYRILGKGGTCKLYPQKTLLFCCSN